MSASYRLMATVLAALLTVPALPVQAKNKRSDRLLNQGRAHEEKKQWDEALQAYEAALSGDPSDVVYRMAVQKARLQASLLHVGRGVKLRQQGQLGEALVELQKAFAISPDSQIAEQEIARTKAMIERERLRVGVATPEERGTTPSDDARKEMSDRIDRLLPIPELQPLAPEMQDFKVNNQTPKMLFDTLALNAGLNIVYDPDYLTTGPKDRVTVSFRDSTVEQALDQAAMITKSYWKPLNRNTIFVTMDNATKRRDYEDEVARVFYLSNTTTPAELTAISTMVRTVADCPRIFPMEVLNALVLKCTGDRMALAEKLIVDVDKPRGEVVVDIFVMEASSEYVRNLTTAIASTGLDLPVTFDPRKSIQSASDKLGIPLSHAGQVNAGDFAATLPSALFRATLSDTRTKVLQSPQIRSVDGQKAVMKIGERQPTASGSSQTGLPSNTPTGISALVNTQFIYLDVGVNVEVLPHVHENGDISLHINVDVSNVTGTKDLGGISEPIIGQRKIEHDVRLREGEVSLLGGLLSMQDSKTKTGTPGLADIPVLGRLFRGDSVNRERDELMIALVPHVIRKVDVTAVNMRAVNTGPSMQVSLKRAPRAVAPIAPVPELPLPPVTAPPEVSLAFPESAVEKSAGESFAMTVEGDAASGPLTLQFDPNILSLDSVSSTDGTVEKNVMNDLGRATIRLSSTALSTRLSLQFRARRAGVVTVRLGTASAVVTVK